MRFSRILAVISITSSSFFGQSYAAIKQNSSTEEQKTKYRSALHLVESDFSEAILAMDTFAKQNPESDLADNAIYWIAELYIQKNEFRLAKAELIRILNLYPHSDRAKRAHATLLSMEDVNLKSPVTRLDLERNAE